MQAVAVTLDSIRRSRGMRAGEDNPKARPWPGFFLVRPTGEVVPMIAVDELPPGVDLLGIPRSLDLEATIGMLNLGIQPNSNYSYHIVTIKEKGTENKDPLPTPKTSNLPPAPPTSSNPPETHHPSTPAPTTATPSTPPSTPRPPVPRPSPPRAEPLTCRHWCTHGTCRWGQGCRYRHAMPMTLPGLRAIGLHDWPAWYRSLNLGYFANSSSSGCGSQNPMGRRGGACCAAGSRLRLAQKGVQRLRAPAPAQTEAQVHGVGEREVEKGKSEDGLGEQILRRLASMQRVDVSGDVLLERAAVNDHGDLENARGAEDGAQLLAERKVRGVGKEKLVDV